MAAGKGAAQIALDHQHALLLRAPAKLGDAFDVDEAAMADRGARGEAAGPPEVAVAQFADGERIDLADDGAAGGDGDMAPLHAQMEALFRPRLALGTGAPGGEDVLRP